MPCDARVRACSPAVSCVRASRRTGAALRKAIVARPPTPGRGPKIAPPTRTIVAPSAIASSKSPLIPIEQTPSPRSSVMLPEPGEDGPGIAGGGRHRHQALDAAARAPGTPRRARVASRPVRSRPFAASPVTLTCTSTAAPGACRRPTSAASSARSIDCHSATCGATDAHLVALQPPDEVPAHSGRGRCVVRGHRLGLRDELLGAVLAEVGRARGDRGADARRRRPPSSRRRASPRRVRDRPRAPRPRRARAPRPSRSATPSGLTAAPRSSPAVRCRRRAGTRSSRRSRRCRRRSRRTRRRPPRSSTTRIAAGMSSAGRPSRGAALDLGPELRDEAARGRRRRTRSAAGRMHGPRNARTSPVPIVAQRARPRPRSRRPRGRGDRRARRRPRRRTRRRAARSRR